MKYTHIASKPAKWTPDGESFRQFHIVSGNPSEDDIDELFRERCHCEHDCCGHVNTGISSTRRLPSGSVAVRQYGWRNL